MGSFYIGKGPVERFCKHGNELDIITVHSVEFGYVCPKDAQNLSLKALLPTRYGLEDGPGIESR